MRSVLHFLVMFIILNSLNSATVKLTHFWDCNGMGCDSTKLQPWNDAKYVASPGYSPQDPRDHGGASSYGETMWLVGAASDSLSSKLGTDDSCCGRDDNDNGVGGCGKCILITNLNSTNPTWKAIVMKKSRCPPWSNGCDQDHMDIAVPGFDNAQYSTANVCGVKSGTGFTSQSTSYVCGAWYNSYSSTSGCKSKCDLLPTMLRPGCKLFASWGWKQGNPSVTYQVVPCPTGFKNYIAKQFGASGPTPTNVGTSSGPSTTTPVITSAPTSATKTCATVTFPNSNEYWLQLKFASTPSSVKLVSGTSTFTLAKSSWSSLEWTSGTNGVRVASGSTVKVTAVIGGVSYSKSFSWISTTSASLCTGTTLEVDDETEETLSALE